VALFLFWGFFFFFFFFETASYFVAQSGLKFVILLTAEITSVNHHIQFKKIFFPLLKNNCF
jgi:hypothetical protein